jgi:hypothetical protein
LLAKCNTLRIEKHTAAALRLGLIIGVRKPEEVREGEKGKKGVDVKAGREGICSLVSCAGGHCQEGVVGLGVEVRR